MARMADKAKQQYMNSFGIDLESLDWDGKSVRGGCKNDLQIFDISVRHHNSAKNTRNISIIFRDDCEEIITSTGYVKTIIVGNFLYFKQASPEDGIKITKHDKNAIAKMTIRKERFSRYLDFIGDYFLNESNGYYCVNNKKKGVRHDQ